MLSSNLVIHNEWEALYFQNSWCFVSSQMLFQLNVLYFVLNINVEGCVPLNSSYNLIERLLYSM